MPTVECIENWRGQDVLDASGEKAGRLDEVYYDSTSHEPVLLSIKHGILGRQATLVPAAEAVVSRDYLRLPYSTEQISQTDTGRVQDELSSEDVAAIAAMFKVSLPNGPLYGAALIERRRIEAEKANQRAHELQLEAEQRARQLEEAQQHASAAAEEAQAAERERERAQAATLETNPQPPAGA
jgi:hypothetical protein